jgi:hypothetical protein
MKAKKTFTAESIKIGIVKKQPNKYYLDTIDDDGNQQTIATGTLQEILDLTTQIIFI